MVINNIIFDFGGVILTNDWNCGTKSFFTEFSEYFNVSTVDMERGWRAGHHSFFEGKITEDVFWELFLEEAKSDKTDVEEAKKIWRKYQNKLESFDLLAKLKSKYTIVGFTNISKEWLDFKKEKFKLDDYFDVIISSGYFGVAKTNQGIYDIVMKKLNVESADCVFIDDIERNLKPARKMGMKTILFKGKNDLEIKLMEIGIKF